MVHTTGNTQIVPMGLEHIESFHACLDAVARERKWLGMVQAVSMNAIRDFTEKGLAAGNIRLVALDGAAVVGWCDIARAEREGFRHCGTLGMGVSVAYRGKGIGRRLIEAAIDGARRNGLERVELTVYASNGPAISLYQKLGFKREGVKRKGRFVDGRYDDVIHMALFLK